MNDRPQTVGALTYWFAREYPELLLFRWQHIDGDKVLECGEIRPTDPSAPPIATFEVCIPEGITKQVRGRIIAEQMAYQIGQATKDKLRGEASGGGR